jgi:hypothetical protein
MAERKRRPSNEKAGRLMKNPGRLFHCALAIPPFSIAWAPEQWRFTQI